MWRWERQEKLMSLSVTIFKDLFDFLAGLLTINAGFWQFAFLILSL